MKHVLASLLLISLVPIAQGQVQQFPLGKVVKINTDKGELIGAGFLCHDRIVTCQHVIDGMKRVHIQFKCGRKCVVRVLKSSETLDLAVLSLPQRYQGDTLILARDVRLGEKCWVIGHPRGYDWSLSKGIVSCPDRKALDPAGKVEHYLQTDAPINPGNSGGPVLNRRGEVIGVVSWIHWGDGLGFAVPSHVLRKFLFE